MDLWMLKLRWCNSGMVPQAGYSSPSGGRSRFKIPSTNRRHVQFNKVGNLHQGPDTQFTEFIDSCP